MIPTRQFPPRTFFWGCLLLPLAAPLLLGAAEDLPAERISVRVRVEWGPRPGGKPKGWTGTFEVTGKESRLLDPVSLAIEADQPGRVKYERQRLTLRPTAPRSYDGFDVTIEARRDAELVLALSSPNQAAEPIRLALTEILEGPTNRPLDDQENHVWFRRAPGDELRVEFKRDHLIFRPDEQFDFNVRLNLLASDADIDAGRGRPEYANLEWDLVRARTNQVEIDGHVGSPERFPNGLIPLVALVPPKEGVYDLQLRLTGRGLSTVERTIQLVVLESDRPEPDEDQPNLIDKLTAFGKNDGKDLRLPGDETSSLKLVEIQSIHPTSPTFPTFGRKRFLSSNDWQTTKTPLGKLLATGPNGWPGFPSGASQPPVSWVAFSLTVRHSGKPHLLEVEYPNWHKQTLGISIIEPNAAGKVMPLGLDSGVYTNPQPNQEQRLQTHRLLFWPKTNEPYVLLTNRRNGSPALVGKITLHEIRGRFPRGAASGEPASRLLGPYLQKPLFSENFGAEEAPDGQRSLDDWLTYYQGATRLVDYLHYSGQNSLALTVLADGSTIYPSKLLEPTPRHDTGVFFSTAQDPLRKDVLELLFSLFDREGLRLIPVLSFTAPLPELERLLDRNDPASDGIELVGSDGRTWRASRPNHLGVAPYYNPLDPRVQDAMRRVVRELVDRYGRHRSFAGIGIELSGEGYAVLPGMGWGYDDATIQRFTKDSGTTVPGEGLGQKRFALRKQFLGKKQRLSWMRWRSVQLAEFYRSLRDAMVATRGDANLYLMGNRLLRLADGGGDPYQALSQGASLEEMLASKGISPALYRDEANLVLLRPSRIASLDRQPGGALDEDLNTSPELDRLYQPLSFRGCLFVHEPYMCRLKDFDRTNLWKEMYTWLVAQPVASGRWGLEPYARAMARLDPGAIFDGGWMIPLGGELTTRDWFRTFLALPNQPFLEVDASHQPVTIRTSSVGEETVLYLVNDFPWKVHVQLDLSCKQDVPLRRLGPGSKLVLNANPQGGSRLVFELKPFDLQAVALGESETQIIKVQRVLDDAGREQLERKFQLLKASLMVRKNQVDPSLHEETFQTSFEEDVQSGALPKGWRVLERNEEEGNGIAVAELDSEVFHEGKRSLRFHTERQTATLLGPSFPRPKGRVLGMYVWMRSEGKPARVQIAFEGTYEGRPYVRASTVEVMPQWTKPFLLRIFDLPDEGIDSLRVRFDLRTPGTVWIDDVSVILDPLTGDEQREFTKTVGSVHSARQQNRWADLRRLLESYWVGFLVTHWPPETTIDANRQETAGPTPRSSAVFRR